MSDDDDFTIKSPAMIVVKAETDMIVIGMSAPEDVHTSAIKLYLTPKAALRLATGLIQVCATMPPPENPS